ncbi:hypothetical protein E2C01_090635 [Portunus trituberculatus]|uniref:Uncharacterized protein n=1 Tax=Portunus trituberculatus TaxID=210409 RepID=A0A5B7JSX7_PORTR|nr:hypothetical protein [Portunus trituberculatus]
MFRSFPCTFYCPSSHSRPAPPPVRVRKERPAVESSAAVLGARHNSGFLDTRPPSQNIAL